MTRRGKLRWMVPALLALAILATTVVLLVDRHSPDGSNPPATRVAQASGSLGTSTSPTPSPTPVATTLADISGRAWRLRSIGGSPIARSLNITLEFTLEPDGRFAAGMGPCSSARGTMRRQGDDLVVVSVRFDYGFCPPPPPGAPQLTPRQYGVLHRMFGVGPVSWTRSTRALRLDRPDLPTLRYVRVVR